MRFGSTSCGKICWHTAQVLDRLNPLLEPGGELLLNEAGAPGGRPRILRPHPNFRLVLSVDPRCVAAAYQLGPTMGQVRARPG